MAFGLILLVLPSLVYARISVTIDGQFQMPQPKLQVHFSGNQVDLISPRERDSFKLGDANLKNAVGKYHGLPPNDAFLTSPTPWGDLYKRYSWPQVSRTLVPRGGRVIRTTAQPQIVLSQIFENKSTKPAVFNVGISQTVQNTATSKWTRGGDLTVSQEISHGINIGLGHSGPTNFAFTSAWGVDATKSNAVKLGATSSMAITLKPGQSVTAELQATKGIIQVEIEYGASLSGMVACNYKNRFKGHHFWSLPVGPIMASGGLPNMITSKQVIDIAFYSQSKVAVRDTKGGLSLMSREF